MFPSLSLNHGSYSSLGYTVTGCNLSEAQLGAGAKFAYFPHLLIGEFVASKLNAVSKVWRTRDMNPSAPVHNGGNGFLGNLKFLANGVLVNPVSHHLKYFNDLFFRQLGVVVGRPVKLLLEARSVGVKNIFRLCYPLKIFSPVVKFVTVDMIGNMLRGWGWPGKSLKNHSMYAKTVLAYLRCRRRDCHIAPCGLERLEDRTPSDAAKITDFVVSLIAGKRLPSFIIINHAEHVVTHARNYNTQQA